MFPEPHFIDTNGIRMAVHEMGAGEPVVFVHGFPELAFSWRFQLPAIAASGFRAIAPDQRGYGKTDAPPDVEDYRIQKLVADLCGLLDALELERATFVGHDWGALVLWHMALLQPERIERMAVLNIPFWPRTPADPIELARQRLGNDFYIVNFQDSDEADQAFAANPGHFFDMLMRKNQVSRVEFEKLPPENRVLSLLQTIARTEASGDPLLSAEERAYFVSAFEHSGFTGPINWYRNWSRNWESMEGVRQVVNVPTLFIGAENDVLISPEHVEGMKPFVPDLEIQMLNCGHWTQQERPAEVNQILVDWLTP
jgi:pimeloyl-ACP methyl ester carboxylesterase